eukprot:12489177-Alexandrium_andersonii.AAC.1
MAQPLDTLRGLLNSVAARALLLRNIRCAASAREPLSLTSRTARLSALVSLEREQQPIATSGA